MTPRNPHLLAARIVLDAGGELLGRTRLQKVAYLAQLAGFSNEFTFEYHHFGPYSSDLARGMEIATALGLVKEVEKQAKWGGRYSVYYSLRRNVGSPHADRATFVQRAKAIGALELELAATAAYLYEVEGIGVNGEGNPWQETRLLKPEKASEDNLLKAAKAYAALRQVHSPKSLPELPPP